MLDEYLPPRTGRQTLRGELARAYLLGSLAYSARHELDLPARAPRAVGWYRRLLEHDVVLPFGVVLDLGYLLLDGEQFRFRSYFADSRLAATERRTREEYEAQVLVRRLQERAYPRLRRLLRENRDVDLAVAHTLELLLRPVAARLSRRFAVEEPHGLGLDVGRADPQAAAEAFEAGVGAPGLLLAQLGELAGMGALLDLDRCLADEHYYEIEHIRTFPRESLREAARRILRVERLLGPPRRASSRAMRARALAETALEAVGTYPTGGIAELTTTGPLENLAAGELAYLEPDEAIDPFLVRFAEGQLLKHLRDSAVLHMMRRTVLFCVEDAAEFACPITDGHELHGTKIIRCLMGLVLALTADLLEVFRKDDLTVDLHLVAPGEDEAERRTERQEMLDVLHLLLREKEEQGTASITRVDDDLVADWRRLRHDPSRQTSVIVIGRPETIARLGRRRHDEASPVAVQVGGEAAAETVGLNLGGDPLPALQAAREEILARVIG